MTAIRSMSTHPFLSFYSYLKDYDPANSQKVLDLIDKIKKKEMMIGFAGHFSAGKSTLINRLLNYPILPSGPIPTSANIVHLRHGPSAATTYMKRKRPVKFEGEFSFDDIQSLCKDGDTITRIDIQNTAVDLPANVSVLDTPGVDSTNDADRLITESSLHLMDYMYYVMDYNHVQSEVNLKFLQRMQSRGTSFSVVVNQIDKHTNDELSFEEFKRSVNESLTQWGIEPDSIYYLSLKDFSMEENEFTTLSEHFSDLFHRAYEEIESHALTAGQVILREAVESFREDVQVERADQLETIEKADAILEDSSFEEVPDMNAKLEEFEERYKDRILSFIPNAYLMPATLRESAKLYLESVQPGFKVGRFFAKKKTEEEQLHRESVFVSQLNEEIEKNLIWPLRERYLQLAEKMEIKNQEIITRIQNISFLYKTEYLTHLIERGAAVTGEYVLRYTDQVSGDVKKRVRKMMNELKEDLLSSLNRSHQSTRKKHEHVFMAMEKKKQALSILSEIDARITDYEDHLTQSFQNDELSEEEINEVARQLSERKEQAATEIPMTEEQENKKQASSVPEQKISSERQSATSKEVLINQVNRVLSSIEDLDALKDITRLLKNKKERLVNRRYTVALFGAFSAGKSSFANALMGAKVLPASPNPTTATINKISPPDEEHPHGFIKAKVKTEKQMLEDLISPMDTLQVNVSHLEDAYNVLSETDEDERLYLDQRNRSLIHAFVKGYPQMKEKIGQTVSVSEGEFSSYVANEQYSCFIESMEVYYDCEWTRSGLTLVDTPGADSVHTRHTDVAFEYIKDADAVLFLTYYNHPFSKADQSFLTQLGRVKDSFSMDKMFFILNAKDLASSENELKNVEEYVKEQLSEFQIHFPRLFSVSSRDALEKDDSSISGMDNFEKDFRSFLEVDLQEVLMQSINEDLSFAEESLKDMIEDAELGEEERIRKLEKIEQEHTEAMQVFTESNVPGVDLLSNKIEKQVHYVHERMLLNFNDYFKSHINPATVNGKDQDVRNQLKQALEHLSEELNYELKQELRAVSLRIERFLEERMDHERNRKQQELINIRRRLRLLKEEWISMKTPAFTAEFQLSEKEMKSILKTFNNTRSFFEKNEKEIMKDKMKSAISPLIKTELSKEEGVIFDVYHEKWSGLYHSRMNEWKDQIEREFNRLTYQLKHPINLEDVRKRYEEVQNVQSCSNL